MKDWKGLTAQQVETLRRQWGENRVGGKKKSRILPIFLGQFRDAMILILLVATGISAFLGEYTEALTIIAIVLLNAIMGFLQEYRTERTLERLAELSAPGAEVIRGGERQKVQAWELVPGDLVLVEAGSRVAADGLLLDAVRLSCDESLLTGESEGVEKAVCETGDGGRVFMGTLVTGGHGLFQVTATGQNTRMGGIAGMLDKAEQPETPLQHQLAQLSTVIGLSCLAVCGLVAGVGILRGEDWMEMLLTGISLAVAAVPEGLPAIVTISLALSVGRMVKQNALIRRLPAVEALGCAGVICSDKTGTLTENRMTVRRVVCPEGIFPVERQGDVFRLMQNGKPIDRDRMNGLQQLLRTAVLCNHAEVVRKAGRNRVQGEATEAALAEAAAGLGVQREALGGTVTAELPFDSSRKRMTVCVQARDGSETVYAKGAPDYLLPACNRIWTQAGVRELTPFQRERILKQAEAMGEEALRVLAFAYRPAEKAGDTDEKNLIYLGMAGLLDPPRREAFQAVEACRQAQIRPVMITGDLAVTAKAIAQELKIWRQGDLVITGQELDHMSEEELNRKVGKISVFARVTPEHKLRIVRAFRRQGAVVAMTGDGVNDAPALREADIGVAMGKGGTDVAREAASLILLDDNFATLVQAVREGRVIYQNIRRFIRYLLSCNTGEVLTMFCAMAMGMPIPLLPIQILLVNLVTDGLPAVALGLEPGEPGLMSQKPRRRAETVFSGGLGGVILLRGALIALTTLLLFGTLLRRGESLELARTAALVTLIVTQLLHAFECKSEEHGILSIRWGNNPALLAAEAVSMAAVGLAVWCPLLNPVFATVPLPWPVVRQILLLSLAAPFFSSLYLSLSRHLRRSGNQALKAPKVSEEFRLASGGKAPALQEQWHG